MDAVKIIESMRVHSGESAYARVFMLGCFERRVTLYSQQVRALNLIHALFATDRLRAGARLAVIGGGVAGMTACAGARRRGVHVTLLERETELLPLFRRPATRWLHPGVYDWPLPGWDRHQAQLPVMTWEAGLLGHVVAQFDAAWRDEGAGVNVITRATDIILHADRVEPRVTWNAPLSDGGHLADNGTFDAVIVAVGFGREPTSDTDRGYWQPDDIDDTKWFDPKRDEPRTWLVSGCGDGGLSEIFRLCLRDFRHDRFLEEFFSDSRLVRMIAEIKEIEQNPLAADPDTSARFLSDKYRDMKAPFLVDILKERLRKDTKVWLNGTTPDLFDPAASTANRFLLSQLRHAGAFHYLASKLQHVEKSGNDVNIQFAGQAPRTFNRYVCRHGPRPAAVEEAFPDLWQRSLHLRETWKRAPNLLDHTRTRIWKPGDFESGALTPVIDTGAPPSTDRAALTEVKYQVLPRATRALVKRQSLVERVIRTLDFENVCWLFGLHGIGKTTLAKQAVESAELIALKKITIDCRAEAHAHETLVDTLLSSFGAQPAQPLKDERVAFRALKDLVDQQGDSVLLILDELDAFTPASARPALDLILSSDMRTVIISTQSPDAFDSVASEAISSESPVGCVRIFPFEEEESRSYLQSHGIDSSLTVSVHRLAGGNPTLLAILTDMVVDTGRVEPIFGPHENIQRSSAHRYFSKLWKSTAKSENLESVIASISIVHRAMQTSFWTQNAQALRHLVVSLRDRNLVSPLFVAWIIREGASQFFQKERRKKIFGLPTQVWIEAMQYLQHQTEELVIQTLLNAYDFSRYPLREGRLNSIT